jgi:hypothetical protein
VSRYGVYANCSHRDLISGWHSAAAIICPASMAAATRCVVLVRPVSVSVAWQIGFGVDVIVPDSSRLTRRTLARIGL